jgi:hypothetical protein
MFATTEGEGVCAGSTRVRRELRERLRRVHGWKGFGKR